MGIRTLVKVNGFDKHPFFRGFFSLYQTIAIRLEIQTWEYFRIPTRVTRIAGINASRWIQIRLLRSLL
jgi:hypothetical protein